MNGAAARSNVEIIRDAFDAFARGDLDAVLERLDPDVDWQPAIAPILGVEAVRGKEGVRRFFTRDLFDGFDDFRAEPLTFEEFGNAVLVTVRYTGRGESTGLELDQTFVTVYTLRDGRAVTMHDYPTREEALEAVKVEVASRAIDAFNETDVGAFAALTTPDFEWSPSMAGIEGEIFRGREGIERYFGSLDHAWEKFHVHRGEFREAGNVVVMLGRLEGLGKGSGVPVDAALGMVFDLRDGTIARIRGFLDHEDALRAAGLS